jgi:hypothetical protein
LYEIDILPYLADTSLSVYAETAIMEYIAAGGYGTVVATISARALDPYAKLRAIRHRVRGRGVKVRHFLQLLSATGNLGDAFDDAEIYVGGKKESCRLRARLPLTDSFLGLLGYYIAEGNGQRGSITIANRHPLIRGRIEQALRNWVCPIFVRQCSDYQISSTALTVLLGKLCGKRAQNKHGCRNSGRGYPTDRWDCCLEVTSMAMPPSLPMAR